MSSASNLIAFGGWAFLPGLVTSWVQSFYYAITIRAGSPKPSSASPRYALHRRRIHTAVILIYLFYTIYEVEHVIRSTPTFYESLTLSPRATDREIKSRFRRLAAIHHPDKLAPQYSSSSSAPGASAEDYFLHLKLAQDTLLNPARRFAYERFGPDALTWPRCSSVRDFLSHGVQAVLPYYGAAALGLYVVSLLGYLKYGKHWRWLSLACMCVFELHVVSRPYFPVVADRVINPLRAALLARPPYLPFELIALARKVVVTVFIALNQIGPLYETPHHAQSRLVGADAESAMRTQLARLDAAVKMTDAEARRLLSMEMAPFVGNEDGRALTSVKNRVRDWLVQNTIRSDPEVRNAMGRQLMKARQATERTAPKR